MSHHYARARPIQSFVFPLIFPPWVKIKNRPQAAVHMKGHRCMLMHDAPAASDPRGLILDPRCYKAHACQEKFTLDSVQDFPYAVVQMAGIGSLGQFEQLVLAGILSLRESAYGVSIHGKVLDLAEPKKISLGAIYVTLDRLEDKGFVSSWLSDPTSERGGRAKRCYRVEAIGERALQESAATAARISEVITRVFGRDWSRKWTKEWKKETG